MTGWALLAQEDLAEEGVVSHFVESDEHLTGCVAVFVDETGERSMVSGRGADFYLLTSRASKETIRHSSHLHMTAWSFFVDPPRSAARAPPHLAQEAGATLSFDPGSFQMIEEMGVSHFLGLHPRSRHRRLPAQLRRGRGADWAG